MGPTFCQILRGFDMTKPNADHVVMHDGSKGFWGFECTRCKQRQELPKSVLLPILTAAGKAFMKLHRACKVVAVALTLALTSCIAEPSPDPDVATCLPDASPDSPSPMPPPEPTATSPQQPSNP